MKAASQHVHASIDDPNNPTRTLCINQSDTMCTAVHPVWSQHPTRFTSLEHVHRSGCPDSGRARAWRAGRRLCCAPDSGHNPLGVTLVLTGEDVGFQGGRSTAGPGTGRAQTTTCLTALYAAGCCDSVKKRTVLYCMMSRRVRRVHSAVRWEVKRRRWVLVDCSPPFSRHITGVGSLSGTPVGLPLQGCFLIEP